MLILFKAFSNQFHSFSRLFWAYINVFMIHISSSLRVPCPVNLFREKSTQNCPQVAHTRAPMFIETLEMTHNSKRKISFLKSANLHQNTHFVSASHFRKIFNFIKINSEYYDATKTLVSL